MSQQVAPYTQEQLVIKRLSINCSTQTAVTRSRMELSSQSQSCVVPDHWPKVHGADTYRRAQTECTDRRTSHVEDLYVKLTAFTFYVKGKKTNHQSALPNLGSADAGSAFRARMLFNKPTFQARPMVEMDTRRCDHFIAFGKMFKTYAAFILIAKFCSNWKMPCWKCRSQLCCLPSSSCAAALARSRHVQAGHNDLRKRDERSLPIDVGRGDVHERLCRRYVRQLQHDVALLASARSQRATAALRDGMTSRDKLVDAAAPRTEPQLSSICGVKGRSNSKHSTGHEPHSPRTLR